WERLRLEDHFLNIARKNVSADVPIVLDVRAVAPPDRVGHHFRDYGPERPQFHVPRPQQSNEGSGKVLVFDDNGALVLLQGSHELRPARYTHGNRPNRFWRLSVNVVGLEQRSRPSFGHPNVDRLGGCWDAPRGWTGRCDIVRHLATYFERRLHGD